LDYANTHPPVCPSGVGDPVNISGREEEVASAALIDRESGPGHE